MAFRPSPYFNNPQFAQAASNIASMFAPPSGADASGWANAKAKQDETSRIAQLFDLAQAEEFNQQQFDRMGVAAGQWAPNQSYYGVDQGNATQRYGIDVGAQTSRANNSADNVRALTDRGMQEAAAMERLGITDATTQRGQDITAQTSVGNNVRDNQRSAIGTLFGPLNQGQIRPDVPSEFMDALGLPEVAAVAGAPKPMTAEEVKGQRILGLDPDLQDAIAFGSTPVENIVTPGGPQISTRLDAIGKEPVIADRSPGTVRMYRTKDGQVGRTVDGMTDMVTNLPVPADALVGSISDTSESFGTSELSKARENILGRRAGLTSMIDQVAAIDGQLAGANADQAIGVIGSGARIFNDMATQANAALRAAGIAAPEGLRDVQRYQDTFRALGIQNAELQSALLDLAYATATSREPGKLTDADVQRAMQTLGANLQDPQAMRQVLRGAVQRSRMDYDAQERTYFDAFGDNLNLGRAQFRDIAPLEGAAPGGGPVAAGQPTGEEQWERGPDGRLRRVAQ